MTKTTAFIVVINLISASEATASLYRVRGTDVRAPQPAYVATRAGVDDMRAAMRACTACLRGFAAEYGYTVRYGSTFELVGRYDQRSFPVIIENNAIKEI